MKKSPCLSTLSLLAVALVFTAFISCVNDEPEEHFKILDIAIFPKSIEFDETEVGGEPSTVNIIIVNNFDKDVTITSVTPSDAVFNTNFSSNDASISSNGGYKTIIVTFTPTEAKDYAGSIIFTIAGKIKTVDIITARGVAGFDISDVAFNPAKIEFDETEVGGEPSTVNIIIVNNFDKDVTITSVTPSDAVFNTNFNSNDASISSNGGYKTITIIFTPTEAKGYAGNIIFTVAGRKKTVDITTAVGIDNIYEGNVSIMFQENVDSFASYTSITGYLSIQWGINSLAMLQNLTSIGGNLSIFNNSDLTSLEGLENLRSIGGGLNISYNANLKNIEQIKNLKSAEVDFLFITNNALLMSLSALKGITSVTKDLTISNNNSLVNFVGLEGVTSVTGNLAIENGSAIITSLDELGSLVSVGGDMTIVGGGVISSLVGLINLTSIGGNFIIRYNAITNLEGLENLTSIGKKLAIFNNDLLASLTGLEKITSIGGDLDIGNNVVLSNFCGIKPLLVADGLTGTYNVVNNASDPTQEEVKALTCN